MNEELKIIIKAEVDAALKDIKDTKEEIDDLGKEGKKNSGTLKEAFTTIGDASKKGLAIMAGAATAALAGLVALSATTKEYREEQAKLVSAFESAGASADTAKNTYNDLYRVLGDGGQATEAANHLAKLTTNEQELSQWTTICQGVYATFGDSLPIEGLTEAANETAKVGTVTGGLADALNWAGVSEDEFNEKLAACNSEAEREKLIRETLNGIYEDSAKTYEKNAEGILKENEAQAKLDETMARVGEAVAPVKTALMELAATILEQFAPAIQSFMDEHGETLKNLLIDIGTAIGNVIGFIVSNIETISLIAGIILAIVAAIWLYNAAMAVYNIVMAPVNLVILAIVAAIVALIAIITLCIVYWDEIKEAAVKCWEWIKGAWDKAMDFFKGIGEAIVKSFKAAWQGIKDAFAKVGEFFSGVWNSITKVFSVVGSWFSGIFKSAVDGIKNVFSGIASFFSGVWTSIKNIFSKVGSAIGDAITGTVKRAVNGVLSMATKIINGFISAINTAISVINVIPGVNIKKLEKLQAPQLAKGGIVDSATLAVIGEQGKEAVVPLENNTEWIDLLANRLGAKNNKPIYLMIDKRVLGIASAEGINDITRQTGAIPLVFA